MAEPESETTARLKVNSTQIVSRPRRVSEPVWVCVRVLAVVPPLSHVCDSRAKDTRAWHTAWVLPLTHVCDSRAWHTSLGPASGTRVIHVPGTHVPDTLLGSCLWHTCDSRERDTRAWHTSLGHTSGTRVWFTCQRYTCLTHCLGPASDARVWFTCQLGTHVPLSRVSMSKHQHGEMFIYIKHRQPFGWRNDIQTSWNMHLQIL